ncbi:MULTISPECIES: DegV family protein [Bacillaceae]|uniref:DegV family protein n=1 Tax=Evansella alkalicola TaxID=745819 RepID=A0ABS6JR41_9BACI|nr:MULTISPECIES: DegV family protein [Bacillaceae]MBU9721026.1 DegV family protein [Bacillus alkalicola]
MKKKKIAWVTDSTAYLTQDLLDHPDVYHLPIVIMFEDQVYEDGVDLTTEELYKRLREEKNIPKTSQPSVGKFAELYDKIKEEYDCAIAIHISSKLSGTLDSSVAGKDMAHFDVEVVDSHSISYAITTLLKKGIELEKQGVDVKEIANRLREETKNSVNYILLGNLDQFYKGGRMNGAQFLLGSVLQIKPIIQITKNGEIELFEKVRSEKKAINRIIELLKQSYREHNIKQVQIMHGNTLEKAEELSNKIKEHLPNIDIVIGDISSSIAVHAGEGTLGLIWHKEKE